MYQGPVIDCDVHHGPVRKTEYLDYLSTEWRDFVTMPGDGKLIRLSPPSLQGSNMDGITKRYDAIPEVGPTGSSYELLRDQLLDPFGIETAVIGFDVGQETALPNGDLALALTRAMNDWSADKWLNKIGDDRLRGAILVPAQIPDAAADEIRRVGQNPKFVSALIPYNGLGKPFGHPVYHVMYEAMAEMGLPIHLHVNGGEFIGGTANYVGGGGSHHYKFDVYVVAFQATANHILSLIMHGVFEKYPKLNLLLTECGLSWVPWLAASMDANYKLMRRESKWVKKWPSEYLRERLFLATQPMEADADPADREEFVEQLKLFDGIEDMLVFSSDYPHWDADFPAAPFSVLPKDWHDRVFHENARRVLRLPDGATANRVSRAVSVGAA